MGCIDVQQQFDEGYGFVTVATTIEKKYKLINTFFS